jgi:hypothetical protein
VVAQEPFSKVLESNFSAFLTKAVALVDSNTSWPKIEAAAKADAGPLQARALGAWLAEDLLAQGPAKGAADAGVLRARAAAAERALGDAVAKLAVSPGGAAPASEEARESLADLFGGEVDRLSEAIHEGFAKASGSPLVALRPGLALADILPEGVRNERVRFARPIAPPPGLALEPVAHLRQDVARLKHYALHEAAARGGRAQSIASASQFFRAVRPPVTLDGDLSEFRAMSGIANAADAWSDAVRDGLLGGFTERLKARQATGLLGTSLEYALALRALEIERAAADLNGALQSDPSALIIPAEGLLALVVGGGLSA